MDAIRRSASQFSHPDNDLGYGIPDFWRAHLLLGGRDLTRLSSAEALSVLPTAFTNFLDVELYAGGNDAMGLKLYDVLGQLVLNNTATLEPNTYSRVRIQNDLLSQLRAGVYIVDVRVGDSRLTQRVVKTQ